MTFEVHWEQEIYGQGSQLNRYPYDHVVSFVFRHHPRNRPRDQVRVLEIGCGAGNNLWFVAREGFRAAGIEGSPSAVEYARRRFEEEGLEADLRVGDFRSLPFEDDTFDLAFDRGALTCCSHEDAARTVEEVRRVLRPGGRLLLNPYSDRHSSFASGRLGEDGRTHDISAGTTVGVGPLYFSSRREVLDLVSRGWRLLSLQHVELVETLEPQQSVHAEWRAVVEKV